MVSDREWLYRQKQRQLREAGEAAERGGSRGSAARSAAGAVIGVATALYGASTQLPQDGYAPFGDEAKTFAQTERDARTRTQRGATRDKGQRSGGSGQQ